MNPETVILVLGSVSALVGLSALVCAARHAWHFEHHRHRRGTTRRDKA